MGKKVVLITGASSDIGQATVQKLLMEGYIVYAASRRFDRMVNLKELGAHLLEMDITQDETMVEGVAKIIKEQSNIDVLFNNAGFCLYGSVEETNLEQARYQFDVNLFGLARLTQLILPYMRRQNYGTIINTSSMGGKIYTPFGAWYHATKHAVEGFSDCLRIELKSFGIDVVVIEPGIIKKDSGDGLVDPMIKVSKNSAYQNLTKIMVQNTKEIYRKGGGSDATVIAEVVSKAIRSNKPKTRYVAGQMAKPLMFLRKWGGDRLFDQIIMNALRL